MAKIISSAHIPSLRLSEDEQLWAYNGLDSAVTLRVHHSLQRLLEERNEPHGRVSYGFVRAMQGPALSCMLRGVAINQRVRQDEVQRCQEQRIRAANLLNRLADAVWGPEEFTTKVRTKEMWTPIGKRGQELKPRERTVTTLIESTRPRGLNPASPKEALVFFNDFLKFPIEYEIRKTPQGNVKTPSANEHALLKWSKLRTKGPGISPYDRSVLPVRFANPFVSLILTIRDLDKQLAVLRTPLDPDGRLRCSYNVVGTESGRWSSSKNVNGRGNNLQNISPTMRRMFCADEGWRLISTDLEQAESRAVGGLVWQVTGDRTYLDACESSDLHTTVCIMTWRDLPWTNDSKENRIIADRPYPQIKGFSYRDIAKRLGHSANYRGSAYGVSQAVGIPTWIVEEFQARYFAAFRAITDWHDWTKEQLLSCQTLDTPLFRRRQFFGRPTEDKTLREAIAFVPQSTVAEILNYVMYRVWERSILPEADPRHLPIQLLLQNHDAFLFQTPEKIPLPWLIDEVNREFQNARIPLQYGSQKSELIIPGEFVTGWNWAYSEVEKTPDKWNFKDGNPDGLTKWRGQDQRVRVQGAVARPQDWLNGTLARVY